MTGGMSHPSSTAARRDRPPHVAALPAALPLPGSPRHVRAARGLERAERIGELLPDDARRAR